MLNLILRLIFIFTSFTWHHTFITGEQCEDTTENNMISGIERLADLNDGKVE